MVSRQPIQHYDKEISCSAPLRKGNTLDIESNSRLQIRIAKRQKEENYLAKNVVDVKRKAQADIE